MCLNCFACKVVIFPVRYGFVIFMKLVFYSKCNCATCNISTSHYFQDEEDVKAIARLFADMGDSYLELIANGIIFSYFGFFPSFVTVLCILI